MEILQKNCNRKLKKKLKIQEYCVITLEVYIEKYKRKNETHALNFRKVYSV
jgi:uncharacterized protein YggL (DUF469 family)